ncbi:MAG: cytochrome c oxidase accessory protein CcoG [Alphaproteobacteria bacterium]|nr:cytochrome c oxidase accessory protein CcoG [Alphaproteobacteria bacterium]
MSEQSSRKTIPIQPVADGEMVSLYAASKKIYPRTVHGLFARWRWFFVLLTQLVFYGLPWLEWGQRQAVLFDLGSRRFYIFGLVLYPQDFIYLTGLLVISALALFLFTAVAGRLWCGYACPQTVYSEIFMWIERKVEGDRSARMRLDDADFSMEKLVKKWYKHILWIGLSIWTGFTFVGYFTPIRDLGMAFLTTQMGSWEIFWVFFYGFATYGNAGFMREQVCMYMCPYARFQSAMFDQDTLIITYDPQRGEPRGARPRGANPQVKGLGDCVDCTLCVQVCPTGIDIRNGLQYECIGCGACIDVCDTVMDKLSYPRGLIKYTTQNAIRNHGSIGQTWRRVLRPRVLVYTGILLVMCLGLLISLSLRHTLKVDVIRDRASLARITEYGTIENIYRFQFMNATEKTQIYRVSALGLEGIRVRDLSDVEVGPAESRWVVVHADIPYGSAPAGSHKIQFVIESANGQVSNFEKSVFLVPR